MENVMQMVTDRVIAELETGTLPWRKPWCSIGTGAFNRITGKPYSLMNQMLLSHSGEYASFKQWTSLGAHIKRGSHSEIVVFWKWPDPDDQDSEDPEKQERKPRVEKTRRPVLKYFRVFHISQTTGIDPLPITRKLYDTVPIEHAERVFDEYVSREGIRVDREISDRAFYSPASDSVHLPQANQFKRAEEYASTAFHEAVHSTGHPKRLNRPGLQQASFGTAVYSREELVAEIGSCAIIWPRRLDAYSDIPVA